MAKYVLGDAYPVVPWTREWSFNEWREAFLKGEELPGTFLSRLYSEQWDPNEAHKVVREGGWFDSQHPTTVRVRRVRLDMNAVQQRIAKAIWLETGRLVVRNMLPDARQYVLTMREQAQRAAGIETS